MPRRAAGVCAHTFPAEEPDLGGPGAPAANLIRCRWTRAVSTGRVTHLLGTQLLSGDDELDGDHRRDVTVRALVAHRREHLLLGRHGRERERRVGPLCRGLRDGVFRAAAALHPGEGDPLDPAEALRSPDPAGPDLHRLELLDPCRRRGRPGELDGARLEPGGTISWPSERLARIHGFTDFRRQPARCLEVPRRS